jgi:hypothetical protein
MKSYIITQEQLNIVGTIVAELPAKVSMPAIDILRNLQPVSIPTSEVETGGSE